MAYPIHSERHFTGNQIVRDLVLGMADGLTVPFALAAGLTGAIETTWIIVVAGLAEIAAGAIAMGLDGARRVHRRHPVRAGAVRLHQGALHRGAAAAERRADRGHRRGRRRGGLPHRLVHHVIKRIAFLVFPHLTFLDFVGAYDALRRVATLAVDPEVTHRIIGTAPEIVDDSGLVMKPDAVYEDLRAFDLLYVPGGFGTRRLLDDERCIAYLKAWGRER